MKTVRWQDANGTGIEHCQLDHDGTGLRLSGAVAGIRDSDDGGFYLITTDGQFRTREVAVWLTSGQRLHLHSDGLGHWHDRRDGSSLPALAGCTDVDLGMSPATNTLPILRLGLAVGDTAEIRAAYIPLPGEYPKFQAKRMSQRYTRLSGDRYRYASGDFTADLRVDTDTLVLDYPQLYRRL